jgi:hypothetical protein
MNNFVLLPAVMNYQLHKMLHFDIPFK